MVRGASVPKRAASASDGGSASRLGAACKRGLRVFGGFFAVAVGVYVLTFMWFRKLDGPMELPLPVWIMLLPTLVALGAGAVAAVIVIVVDLVRGHREGRRSR